MSAPHAANILESAAWTEGPCTAKQGETNLFLYVLCSGQGLGVGSAHLQHIAKHTGEHQRQANKYRPWSPGPRGKPGALAPSTEAAASLVRPRRPEAGEMTSGPDLLTFQVLRRQNRKPASLHWLLFPSWVESQSPGPIALEMFVENMFRCKVSCQMTGGNTEFLGGMEMVHTQAVVP